MERAGFSYADLPDEELLSAFNEFRINNSAFHHNEHVRLAWLLIVREGASQAEERLTNGIRQMAINAGAPEKFLHTTTIAWTRLVAAAHRRADSTGSFQEWIAKHPELLDRDLLQNYYSPGRLKTPEARAGWVEPDLAPLP